MACEAFTACRGEIPKYLLETLLIYGMTFVVQGGSTILGRLRLALSSLAQTLGDFTLPPEPHLLWVTEFPLFTHADEDKEFLAHGRWSSSHHPFTAPMWEDVEKMYNGQIAEVRTSDAVLCLHCA